MMVEKICGLFKIFCVIFYKMILVQIHDANCIKLYRLKTHLKVQSSAKKPILRYIGPYYYELRFAKFGL